MSKPLWDAVPKFKSCFARTYKPDGSEVVCVLAEGHGGPHCAYSWPRGIGKPEMATEVPPADKSPTEYKVSLPHVSAGNDIHDSRHGDIDDLSHVVFASGAKRSEVKPRYDLIPKCAMKRLAKRYTMGAEKYGVFNWQKGLPIGDTYNHILDHLQWWLDKTRVIIKQEHSAGTWALTLKNFAGRPDDDLAGAMWGIATLMWMEENMKFVLDGEPEAPLDQVK